MRPPECNCHGNQCLKHKNSVLRTVGEAREAVGWANNALRKLTILSRMQPKVEPDCTSSTLSKTKIIFGVRKEYAMKCKKTLTTHPPSPSHIQQTGHTLVWRRSPDTVSDHLDHLHTPFLIPKLCVVWGIQGFGGLLPYKVLHTAVGHCLTITINVMGSVCLSLPRKMLTLSMHS